MRPIARIVSLFLVTALVAGCAAAGPAAVSGMDVLRSEQPRVADPQASPADLESLAAGNRAFALDLYHALGPAGNRFFSPYSISLALAMTYAGARGETAQQMGDTLHFSLPAERLHPAFNAVDQALASRKDQDGEGGQGADGKGFRLHVVNDVWGQKEYPFLPAFLDLLSANYGVGLRLVDFIQDPEGARQAINEYVAEQTGQRIRDLIPPGEIDELTRLVLTNAIYFNAAWKYPFEPSLTSPGSFTRLDGSQTEVQMMQMPAHEILAYQAGDGYQVVALPYENDRLAMWLLVPNEGRYAEFEAALDPARLESILVGAQYAAVRVSMPRFQMEDEFGLGDTLKQLGMPLAFDPDKADFSGISSQEKLFISEVLHKSFVKVDEAGTEAAAATAVIVEVASAPAETIDLTVDRPFIFLISDQPSGSVLFMGRVLEPTAE
jgi:serpin B